MKFKRYYQHQCYSMFGILQLYKLWAICINISPAMTKFDPFDQIVIRVDICNRVWYNLDSIDRITMKIDVSGIFNSFVFVIHILIKKSILVLSLDVLIIIFGGMALNSDKQSEFECDSRNNDYATIITNNFYKIHGTPIVVAFSVDVCYFIFPAMDTSSIPIEFEALIIKISPLILNFTTPLSINTINYHTQIKHNVCTICSFIFIYL